MTRTDSLRAPIFLALLALAACTVKAPPRQSWSLSGGHASGSPALDLSGPSIGVAAFTASAETRTTALTWRDAGGHLVHETQDSWVDYPDRMLEEMTLSHFLRGGSFSKVTTTPPTDGLDAILRCRLVEFGEWDAAGQRETRVTLRWHVSGPDGDVLGSGEARGRALVAAETMTGVVQAHRAASESAIDALRTQVLTAFAK